MDGADDSLTSPKVLAALPEKWQYEPPQVSYDPIYGEPEYKTWPTGEITSTQKVVGFKVEPPFGTDWPHLKTLQHFAALIECRTGHKVRVTEADYKILDDDGNELEAFDVLTGHSTTGSPAPFEVTWAWLSGFENGIHECLWKASRVKR